MVFGWPQMLRFYRTLVNWDAFGGGSILGARESRGRPKGTLGSPGRAGVYRATGVPLETGLHLARFRHCRSIFRLRKTATILPPGFPAVPTLYCRFGRSAPARRRSKETRPTRPPGVPPGSGQLVSASGRRPASAHSASTRCTGSVDPSTGPCGRVPGGNTRPTRKAYALQSAPSDPGRPTASVEAQDIAGIRLIGWKRMFVQDLHGVLH
jgi:hypothetical protein